MKNLLRSMWMLAAAALCALTGDALAGDAVRILVEPPVGVTAVEPGQSIDVQVVGQDAAGNRVAFGGYRVEVTSTDGDFTLVEAPYKYRFVAPASLDGQTSVQLRAWIKQRPDVNGQATLQLVPRRPYERLVLRGPTSVELGKSADIEVLGVRQDGTAVPVRSERLTVKLQGPGTLAAVSPGRYLYAAPPRNDQASVRKTALVVAAMERWPGVGGDLAIVVAREGAPGSPGSPGGIPEGNATRLVVELPQGVTAVEAGQTLDVQVIGVDTTGARVGLGDRRIEMSATEGEIAAVDAPYRWRYTAPSKVDAAMSVQLRAWTRQRPDVAGSVAVQLLPQRPYDRLIFRGPTSVDLGKSIDVEVLGVRPDGSTTVVRDQRIVATVDGPGSLATTGPNTWRYAAPNRSDSQSAGRTVRIMASLERYPSARGELVVLIASDTPPGLPQGMAVRLAVELPQGVASVEPGQSLELQVVGLDAAGARVNVGGRRIEISATDGELVVVEAPYRWRYTAPATVDPASRPVEIRAWLRRNPDVNGTATLAVQPRGTGNGARVEIEGPTSVALGTTADVGVFLSTPIGNSRQRSPLQDSDTVVTLDGPGSIVSVSLGLLRYTAPPKSDTRQAGKSVRIAIALARRPNVKGELVFVLKADGVPAPDPDDVATGVLWPSGNVRLVIGRAKATKADEWPRAAIGLPAPGRSILAAGGFVRLRIQVERDDIRRVELESFVSDRPGAVVRIDDADPAGRLRLLKSKTGRTHAIIETEIPESGRPLVLNLLLTTARGEILRETFTVGRDMGDVRSK